MHIDGGSVLTQGCHERHCSTHHHRKHYQGKRHGMSFSYTHETQFLSNNGDFRSQKLTFSLVNRFFDSFTSWIDPVNMCFYIPSKLCRMAQMFSERASTVLNECPTSHTHCLYREELGFDESPEVSEEF